MRSGTMIKIAYAWTLAWVTPGPKILQSLAYGMRPNLRATMSEASLLHDVLYRGIRPEARIANAHAAVTRGPNPRPRNSSAVSRPASAATSECLAQKQTLTGYPSSTIAIAGARPAAISPATHPRKLR